MLKDIPPARLTQLALAAGFLSFGVAWLAAPDSLEYLFAREQSAAIAPIVSLALSLLGMQALAFGLFALIARFKSWTFLGFAVAMLPLFFVDYWAYSVAHAFNQMTLVHAGGLTAMLAMCAHGFRVLREREEAIEQLVTF
jgi:hypothetical protein